MRHPELRTDAAAILLRVPKLERRGAADHLQPRKLRERGDQILRDPVGEVLLACLPALIRQRQHRDGGCALNGSPRSSKPLECEIPEREDDCRRDRDVHDSHPPVHELTRRYWADRSRRSSRDRAAGAIRRGSYLTRQQPLDARNEGGRGLASRQACPLYPLKRLRCVCTGLGSRVHAHRHNEGTVAGNHVRALIRKVPLKPEVTFVPRRGVRGDDRNEQRAVPDLAPDPLVPRISAAQFAPIKPNLDAGCAQGRSDPLGSLTVLRGVAQKHSSRHSGWL